MYFLIKTHRLVILVHLRHLLRYNPAAQRTRNETTQPMATLGDLNPYVLS